MRQSVSQREYYHIIIDWLFFSFSKEFVVNTFSYNDDADDEKRVKHTKVLSFCVVCIVYFVQSTICYA